MSSQYLSVKGLMDYFGISKRKAMEIANVVGTAPREKGQKIYVRKEKAEEYMEGRQ